MKCWFGAHIQLFNFTAVTESFATRCFTLNVCMRSKDSGQQRKVKRRRVALTELLQEPWKRRCQELCLGSVFKVCKVVCAPVVTPDLMVTWRPLLLALTCSVVDVHAAQQIRFFAYPKCDEMKMNWRSDHPIHERWGILATVNSLCVTAEESWNKVEILD